MNNPRDLFLQLLKAETEDEVDGVLDAAGYFDDNLSNWRPLDDNQNNWSTVGAQHDNATGALVEKIINAVDAALIAGCWTQGIDPESDAAPQTMADAARDLFDVTSGRLDSITMTERTTLAEKNIHLVAVGEKTRPNYLIVDRGEGQTPAQFQRTFLSLRGQNKYGIPFVQGINNCGGSAVIRFCGTKKYQLIASRRHPKCPRDASDETADLWGFTLVRCLWPKRQRRPRPMAVYLAPDGVVPSFAAEAIPALPHVVGSKKAPIAYGEDLPYGTCIKLYAYNWGAKSLATTNAREELEKHLYTLALPVRISETRGYDEKKTHFFQTTLSGQAVNIATHREDQKRGARIEEGFNQVPVKLSLPDIGDLHISVTVYRDTDDQGAPFDTKRIPHGTLFTVNGQVHERAAESFVKQRLGYGYLSKHLLITVDCTNMNPHASYAFFSTARDRTIEGDVKKRIQNDLVQQLAKGDSPIRSALRDLNARRRQERLKNALSDDQPMKVLEDLVRGSQSLAAIFSSGDQIQNPWIPDDKPDPFVGKRFPTYFKIHNEPKGGLVKSCPINRSSRVQLDTDATNDYFDRAESPGVIAFTPRGINRAWNLHNGRMGITLALPPNVRVGDEIPVEVMITDETQMDPFICPFTICVGPSVGDQPSRPPTPRPPRGGSKLAMPEIVPVTWDGRLIDGTTSVKWDSENNFNEFTALEIRPSGDDGKYDFFINMDNVHLLNELRRERSTSEHPLITYYFKYGLTLMAMGMLRERERKQAKAGGNGKPANGDGDESADNGKDELAEINDACIGIASVYVPALRRLTVSADHVLETA